MAKTKKTKYQALQTISTKSCNNPTDANQQRVKKAAESYIKDAVSKGKSKKEATQIANRVMSCKNTKRKKKR